MISIIPVGKIKEKALTTLINEYKKRISNYSKIEIIEVNDEPNDKLEEIAIRCKLCFHLKIPIGNFYPPL